MKYWFMNQHSSTHGVQKMCRVIEASRSGYYRWKIQPQSNRQKENDKILVEIRESHKNSKRAYGSPWGCGLSAAQDRTCGSRCREDGQVLIYVHKEEELDDIEERYPAEHYVLVDDKLRILSAVKNLWGPRVTTVFSQQGHYAQSFHVRDTYPAVEFSLERIGELLQYDLDGLFSAQSVARLA